MCQRDAIVIHFTAILKRLDIDAKLLQTQLFERECLRATHPAFATLVNPFASALLTKHRPSPKHTA